MQSEDTRNGGLGQAVREVTQHAIALAKLEAQLARLELSDKARRYAPAAVLGLTALVLCLFALGYGLAAAVEGLDAVIPRFAALLVVAGALVIVAAGLAGLAYRSISRASPPLPEQAIAEARETKRALQSTAR